MREIANYISSHTDNNSKIEVRIAMFFDEKGEGEEHLKEIKCEDVTDKMIISGVGYKLVDGGGKRKVLIAINWII